MNCKTRLYLWLVVMLIISCRKPNNIPAINAAGNYLVVEGLINSSSDSTIIKLSKTVAVSNKGTSNPVLHATVTVENKQGHSYNLIEAGMGKYVSGGLNLDNNLTYRLRIKTADNKEYLSDFVPVINSPPIDSVNFALKSNGIQLYASTHDPRNSTHYYRWEYQETWVIHSWFYSLYKSNGDTVIDRVLPVEQIYQCWQSDTSTTILLGSSFGLSQDIIVNSPITFIESSSIKLDGDQSIIVTQRALNANDYSILVKQYGLTREAYEYWSNIKKNTEQLGTLFGPLPSEVQGNIHSVTNPLEPVLGYISAGTPAARRIFIKNGQIPKQWKLNSAYSGCRLDSLYLDTIPIGSIVAVNQENDFFNYNKEAKNNTIQIPVTGIFDKPTGALKGHTGSSPQCVDCTLRGTNLQPDYWKLTSP